MHPLFDISRILNIKCQERKEKEKYLLKNSSNLKYYKQIKKIGFPITTINQDEIKGKPALYSEKLMKYIRNNLINLDDKNILKNLRHNNTPEVIVDFTKNSYGD